MIEPIGQIESINAVDVSDEHDFKQLENDSFIDPETVVERPPIALSMGQYHREENYYHTPFGHYGDMSCIVGESKTLKSRLVLAIECGYIGYNAADRFEGWKGHDNEDKVVVSFDTEQSQYDCWRATQDVQKIVGLTKERKHYKFSLRTMEIDKRIAFIEHILYNHRLSDKIGWVTIDQVADLVTNENNIEESKRMIQKLMNWTTERNIHLMCVIHTAYGSSKATGHLGSSIQKKCETVAHIKTTKDEDSGEVIERRVQPIYTRHYPFEQFSFDVDQHFLPIIKSVMPWT